MGKRPPTNDKLRTERRRAGAPKRRAGAAVPPMVAFVSLGCVKNLVDSEKMIAQIAEAGALISGDEDAADTIVVNTCGFLQAARAEVLGGLEELVERKRQGDLKRIVVVGCLVQRGGQKLLHLPASAGPGADSRPAGSRRSRFACGHFPMGREVWPASGTTYASNSL